MTESEIAQLAQPAPRRRDYSDQAITQKPPALTELTLLRYITLIGLATYIVNILFKFGPFLEFLRNNHRFVTWTNSAFAIFSLSLAGLLFAIIVNKHPIYIIGISIAMVAYLQLAVIQITELIIFHGSPWDQLHLGDVAGVPTCLTVSILHRKLGKIGMVVAILIIPVVATSQNVNSIMLRPYVFDVLYSTFVGTPWMYMVHHVVATSRRTDKAAFDEYQALTSIQRSNQLKELEATSLSNIHDRILSTLNNINKGVADPKDIHAIDVFDLVPTGSMPLTTFIQHLKTQVEDDTRVVVPEVTSDTIAIPMEIAATMLAAIEQAHTNSIAHAPQAQRELVATWDESQLSIVFADTGPGFHVAKIPHHHAGVTITMLERPQNHPGVSAQLTTAPEQGTRYRLTWQLVPHQDSAAAAEPLSVSKLIGVADIFRPRWAVYAFLVFFADSCRYNHEGRWPAFIIGAAFFACGLWALTNTTELRLPRRNTIILSGCVVGLVSAGQLAHYSPLMPYHSHWFLSYGLILVANMALRLRPVAAWVVWLSLTAATFVLDDIMNIQLSAWPISLFVGITLFVPATLVPSQVALAVRSLPALERVQRNEHLELARALTQKQYVQAMTGWLRSLLSLVDDPATAGLMQKRLRDAIRSPLLDVPELTAAVWQAREAGTEVVLIDARSEQNPNPDPVEHPAIIANAIAALKSRPSKLTLRLLPPDRSRYATLVYY